MAFTTEKREYIEKAIARAEEAGTSRENIELIRDFTAELRSAPGISLLREMKLTYTLLRYASLIPSFRAATLSDIFRAINEIRDRQGGRKNGNYKPNTIHDYIIGIKQFYRWMIDRNKAEGITFRDLTRIKAPPIEQMTYIPKRTKPKCIYNSIVNTILWSRSTETNQFFTRSFT